MLVTQAARVLDLLEYFVEVKRPSTLPEISEAMGWPRSSTYNLLMTLAERGFLYEPRPRSGYYPSPRWNSLIQDIAANEILPNDLKDAIKEIADATGETVALAAPAGANAIFLHTVESTAAVRFVAQVGYQVPMHATSVGRALLAQYKPRERQALLKKIEYKKFSDRSPLSADQVEAEIRRAGTRGWHQNSGGHVEDLTGVAVPVQLQDRRLSIVVGGPTARMRKRIPEIAAIMQQTLDRHGFARENSP